LLASLLFLLVHEDPDMPAVAGVLSVLTPLLLLVSLLLLLVRDIPGMSAVEGVSSESDGNTPAFAIASVPPVASVPPLMYNVHFKFLRILK
jgi:hypothetical protein